MNIETMQHFHASWLALALLLALSACTTVARREAPLLTSRDAAPAGFPREVMYVDDGRQDYDGDAGRLLWRIRQSAAGGRINVLALSGGDSGVSSGAGALVGWSLSRCR